MARTRTTQPAGVISGREQSQKVITTIGGAGGIQPDFIRNLLGRNRSRLVQAVTAVGSTITELGRSGDIRIEDLFPGSIKDVHIDNLSASKINAGTLDVGLVAIQSDDGAMQITGNIIAIDNATGIRQITIGKYDGIEYGLAIGPDPNNPIIKIDEHGMTVLTDSSFTLIGARTIFQNSAEDKTTQIGYVINQFQIKADTTDGIVLVGNTTVTKSVNPSYGGGDGVLFFGNAQVVPSTNPTTGGILYVDVGALKYRGSSGTVTTIAIA